MKNLIADMRAHPVLFAVGALGIVASFVLLVCSTGTNDIRTWEAFAKAIQQNGLFDLYVDDVQFNHPPLMGLLSWLSLEVSSLLGIPFAVVFKLLPFAANIGVSMLLWAIWKDRFGGREGARAFALSSWALGSVLVGSYHGNTDCAVVFFCLWSVYLSEVRQKPFLAGLALAAAINVKIIPLLIALPALAAFRSFKDSRSFAIGAALAAIPFLFALAGAGTALVRNVFGYASSPEMWGMQIVLSSIGAIAGVSSEAMQSIHSWYALNGRYILFGAILLLAAYGFWCQLSYARLAAAAMTLFFVITPGFGVQYVAYPVPLMFAVSLAWGMTFAAVAGIFAGTVYVSWLTNEFPLYSVYRGYHPALQYLGFASWLVALGFLPACLRRRAESVARTPAEGPARPGP